MPGEAVIKGADVRAHLDCRGGSYAAGPNLVESLAAKDALEKAGVNACDSVIKALAEQLQKPGSEKAE